MSIFLLILLGIVLLILFIIKFRRMALFIFIVGGLCFVAYELGIFSWILNKVFGFG